MRRLTTNTKKIEREITVARVRKRYVWPQARLVRLMNRFRSDVRIVHHGREADGRNVLELMALAAPEGSTVVIRVEGPDAAEAMLAIDRLICSLHHLENEPQRVEFTADAGAVAG